MPRLTLVVERKPVHVYDVGSFVINIGRGEEMQVRIDNVSVSRRQAQIRFESDGRWTVRDLGSANGTFLNGRRLTAAALVTRGDEISFGKFSLFFESPLAEPVAEAEFAPNGTPGLATETFAMNMADVERLQHDLALKRRAQLQWEAKGTAGTFYLDAGAALVGRSPLCDLQVPAGPAHHVLVSRGPAGVEVRNLSWWRRMRVNGRGVERAVLKSGDTIEVGGLRLKFLDNLSPRAPRADRTVETSEGRKP